MIIKIFIHSLILIFIFLSNNSYAQYNLSLNDDLKKCMNDTNCYICANTLDDGSISIEQCIQSSPYDNKLGDINTNINDWVCPSNINKAVCNITTDKDNNTNILCPLGDYSCYPENGQYVCNQNKCELGSNISITDNVSQDIPEMSPPKQNNTSGDNNGGCVEDISKVTIGEGTFGMCRLSSRINPLSDDCCKITINDRDKQEEIMTGAANIISVLGGTYSLISDLFKEFGWANEDFIQVLLTDVMEFLKGGTCSNDEIAIATAAASTKGIVVNNNGMTYNGDTDTGTCVYLGDYCTKYIGYCFKWFGQVIGWDGQCERPARAYCCYSSIFEKALAKAAREQMPDKYNWGNIRGYKLWPYKSKYGEPYTPGNNPCKPDYKELKLNCQGISVFDLVNINMDSEQFQTDMAAFTAITLKDITKEGGSYQQAQENMQKEIDSLKNQFNTNSDTIINNMLDGVDINTFK